MIEKPRDAIAKLGRKGAVKVLDSFRWVGREEIVGCYGEDKAAELVKVQPLKILEGLILVVVYDV